MFKVEIVGYEDLDEIQQGEASDNGNGKEEASYLKVSNNSGTLLLRSDAMEPEDATFNRDLRWIKRAVELAFDEGVASAA